MGVGFAIPINLGKAIASQLIESGEFTRGYLGIAIQPVASDLAESFGIKPGQGILVVQVSQNLPADKAGLRQGDVIVAYRGEPVIDVGNFRNRVPLTSPGSREKLTILREGKKKELIILISELPKDSQVTQGSMQYAEDIGLTVQTLTPQLAEQFDAKPDEGVVVTKIRPCSIAAMAGIEPGSVILQVNRKVVKSAAEFQRAVKENSGKKRVLLLVRKDNMQRFVTLSW